jgi:hypothetical protein
MRSPPMPRRWRLVARTRTCGQSASRPAIAGAPAITCSTLSKTKRRRLSPNQCASASRRSSPPPSRTPTAAATTGRIICGSLTVPSRTSQTPSSKSSTRLAAACSARWVLPTPPGPTRVTSRAPSETNRSAIEESSSSRPRSAVASVGRLVGWPSSVFSGGKSLGRQARTSWVISSGSRRSRNRCRPRSRSVTESGRDVLTACRIASDRSTCPPCPDAMSRARRLRLGTW